MLSSMLTLAYIVINIDPVFHLTLGPLDIPIHWYGLAYVLGISIGLWAILRYARRLGLDSELVYTVFWWAALAGLIGGRLYFVIQQPDLVENYLKHPVNIIAVWQGGMAFFGAIFLGMLTVAFVSWRQKIPIWLALDIAVFFAAVGQIFGRLGNLVNGDIVGKTAGTLTTAPDTCLSAPCIGIVTDAHILPWATVYTNPHTFAQLGVPYQPAAAYELLMNLVLLAILIPLRLRLPQIKAGLLSVVYLAGYAISQLLIFFFRGSEPITPFLGITLFKQAQWTAIIVLVLLIPYYLLIQRTSRPWTKAAAQALAAAHSTREKDEPAHAKAGVTQAGTVEASNEEPRATGQQEAEEAAPHQRAHGANVQEHEHQRADEETMQASSNQTDMLLAEFRTEGITVAPAPGEETSTRHEAEGESAADKTPGKSGPHLKQRRSNATPQGKRGSTGKKSSHDA